ncbi:hypothetical protein LAZ67_14001054 [Cordylochernes scorpioides]|uniref:Uncharacterized protein n=1 Tax=Cordylochernes scorpioides TaxID=51811 RepID=A0ABY6L5V0_9ARAC|nr:hypothetical protein LAZ67_14001054 [Cordylochernes scorpioides]
MIHARKYIDPNRKQERIHTRNSVDTNPQQERIYSRSSEDPNPSKERIMQENLETLISNKRVPIQETLKAPSRKTKGSTQERNPEFKRGRTSLEEDLCEGRPKLQPHQKLSEVCTISCWMKGE